MPNPPERAPISAVVGAEFQVELESTPTTGAVWQWKALASGPRLVREDRRAQDTSPGSSSTQVFTFRADSPGDFVLHFELKRAWEASARLDTQIRVQVR